MAKHLTPIQVRRKLKTLAKSIAQQTPFDDPFHGMGDFVPRDTRLNAVARAIAALEGLKIKKPAPPKPKPVKRAAKKKPAPKPKKGKKVAKSNEICIQSPYTREPQWMPLVSSVSELLAEGWVIIDGDMPVEEAYNFLGVKHEVSGE